MYSEHLLMRSWWVLALRGAAAIAFGAITLAWPGVTVLSLLTVFAVYALLGGGVSVVGAFSNRKHGGDWWALLLLGICGLAVGILTIMNPLLTTFALIVMIGVNALVSGVFDIVLAIRLRKVLQGEWLLVLNALISIAFGILILMFPAAGTFALVWMIGVYALLTGILLLTLAWRAYKLKKDGAFGGSSGRSAA
ncbi:HdeD family acid-resistance protein [Janthinobacterium sp. SUN118]|uniref:HdeD family acid-resistance protein n=1 Tax=Janthinobacterium sp. SUN118 TaxID=3004100 RepID=UPI0025B21EF9|nr:HdeD family acid-resistance protein [Janthinobacterium sp. SUN118]